MSAFGEKIEQLVEIGWKSSNPAEHEAWEGRARAFLAHSVGQKAAQDFREIGEGYDWFKRRGFQIGMLEGLALREGRAQTTEEAEVARSGANPQKHPKRVFVVHGRDVESKESTARFIERLGLEPIILHEQASSGRTVIEKFEVYSDVGFAVVLLTPDDVGGLATEPTNLTGRARQNVILELGYFLGRLTRRRVVALYKKGVEMPSDYQGVLYVEHDTAGSWRTKLAQELVEAGFSIDLGALLKS